MSRFRNLMFAILLTLMYVAMNQGLLAWTGPEYNCWADGNGGLYCYFTNPAAERSCAYMESVCENFCAGLEYLYTYCAEDGGGANHGYCACGTGGGGGGCSEWPCCTDGGQYCGSGSECCSGLCDESHQCQ